MSSSFVPAAMILWESWATLDAIAPFLKLNPLTKPFPILPVPFFQ